MTSRAWPSFGRHTRNHLSTVATVNSEILVGRQDDGVGKRFGHANEASIGEAHGNVGRKAGKREIGTLVELKYEN